MYHKHVVYWNSAIGGKLSCDVSRNIERGWLAKLIGFRNMEVIAFKYSIYSIVHM